MPESLKKQLELWHLCAAMILPLLGGVWHVASSYTRLNALEVKVDRMNDSVEHLTESVNKLIGSAERR